MAKAKTPIRFDKLLWMKLHRRGKAWAMEMCGRDDRTGKWHLAAVLSAQPEHEGANMGWPRKFVYKEIHGDWAESEAPQHLAALAECRARLWRLFDQETGIPDPYGTPEHAWVDPGEDG